MNTIKMLATPSSLPLGNSSKLDCTHSTVTFENQAFGAIRTLVRDAEPWFVGKDVAEALGYKDTRSAVQDHVYDEDKTTEAIHLPGSNYKTQAVFINESGVYSLIFASQLPSARQFKHWVTSDVLPSIRKHGMYATETALNNMLEDPENGIRLLQTIKAEREAKQQADLLNFMHMNDIEDTPACEEYCKQILANKNPIKVAQIAQDYEMTDNAFCQLLSDLDVMYKENHKWHLYQKFFLEGFVQKNTATFVKTSGKVVQKEFVLWTQKGRIFLYERLKAFGVFPNPTA